MGSEDYVYSIRALRNELNTIKKQLVSISGGIRSDFSGIGNEKCADYLDALISRCEQMDRRLINVEITPRPTMESRNE